MKVGGRPRAAFVALAGSTALAFACGTFGTNDDPPPPPNDEAGVDATAPSNDATPIDGSADAAAACIPQSLEPPPPEDPKCGTNGPAFDLEQNDSHCGACNHSCFGDGCANGRCKVVPIGDLENTAEARPTFATLPLPYATYSDGLAIKRLFQDGGTEVVGELASTPVLSRTINSLHTDGKTIVFVVLANGIYSVPVAGGSVTTLQAGLFPYAAVTAKGFVYWSDGSGTIRRYVPATGGSTLWVQEAFSNIGFTADANRVYWFARTPLQDGGGGPAQLKMSVAAEAASPQIRATVAESDGMFLSDGFIYWLDRPNTTVYRLPVEGTSDPTAIARYVSPADGNEFRALTVDATHVYWAISPPQSLSVWIYKAPKCGGPTTKIVDLKDGVVMTDLGMAADDRYLYFADKPKIRRVAK